MKITGIGHNFSLDGYFFIERPHGLRNADETVVLVRSPVYFRLRGEEVLVQENQLVILPGGAPHYYRGSGVDFYHDWFYFIKGENDQEIWEHWKIPYESVISIGNTPVLSGLIRDMQTIYGAYDTPFNEQILEAYARVFFEWVSSSCELSRRFAGLTAHSAQKALFDFRRHIYEQPADAPSCDEAAARLFLSRSRFDLVYKTVFGQSYQADVINSRIQKAKAYLIHSDRTVVQVAEACGYRSVEHFVRQFKEHTGTSPHHFRKIQ